MSELKKEHLVFMSDEMYTPIQYKGFIVQKPLFKGNGNHSITQLEAICEQFKDYVHQQQTIKQNCMKHIVELKFGVKLPALGIEANALHSRKPAATQGSGTPK